MAEPLVERLIAAWRENSRRWEAVAEEARGLGLEVWNPGLYAADVHAKFLRAFPPSKGAVLALGLNPGPYGMAQTGIPFTDCRTATSKLGIPLELPGRAPADLARRLRKPNGKWRGTYERSSLGIYAFLESTWGDLRTAYANWFVGNPCPLLFLDPKAWNVTPADARLRRLAAMRDLRRHAVEEFARVLGPRAVVCLGQDVAQAVGDSARRAVGERPVLVYRHPARAAPRSWAAGLRRSLEHENLARAVA